MPPHDTRNFGLDLMRATAIGLVLLSHGTNFIGGRLLWLGIDPTGFWWLTGVIGVELFFALSGFLIGGILLDLEPRGAPAGAVGIFLVRRWMRTLPLYYVALVVLLLFPALDPAPHEPVWSYALLSQNLVSPMPGDWFGPSWSLTIEEWSYLLLPLLAFGLFRKRRHPVVYAALSLIVAGLAFRLAVPDAAGWDAMIRKLVPARIDAIAYGVLAAAVLRRFPEAARRWLGWSALAGIALAALNLWLVADPGALTGLYHRVLLLPALSVGFCLLLPTVARLGDPGIWALPVRFLSRISYAAYLVHGAFVPLVPALPVHARFVAYIGGTLAVASLLSWLIEQPIMRARPRDLASRRVPAWT